jgi:hypothetical protein
VDLQLLFYFPQPYIDVMRAQTSDQLHDAVRQWHTYFKLQIVSCLNVNVLRIIALTYADEFIQRILAIDIRSNAGACSRYLW